MLRHYENERAQGAGRKGAPTTLCVRLRVFALRPISTLIGANKTNIPFPYSGYGVWIPSPLSINIKLIDAGTQQLQRQGRCNLDKLHSISRPF